MRDSTTEPRRRAPRAGNSPIDRVARIAFTFMVMNASAVAGLVAAVLGKRVWR